MIRYGWVKMEFFFVIMKIAWLPGYVFGWMEVKIDKKKRNLLYDHPVA